MRPLTAREKQLIKVGAIAVPIAFAYAFYQLATSDGRPSPVARWLAQRAVETVRDPADEVGAEPEEEVVRCDVDTDELGRAIDVPPIEHPADHGCYVVHARWSPARDAVAVQLYAHGFEAAVHAPDGAFLWAPQCAVDLAWAADGTLIVLRDRFVEDLEARQMGVPGLVRITPVASEFHPVIERRRWPSREPVDELEISFPMGTSHRLVLAPDDARAAVVWLDQTEWGWRVVDLGAGITVRDAGVFDRDTNLSGMPVFSPSGTVLAAPATASFEWWLPPRPQTSDDESMDEETYDARERERFARGAAGGPTRAGWIWIHDLRTDEIRRIDVDVDLPGGWGSWIDPDRGMPPELGPVRFVDDHTLELRLPDDTTRTIAL